MLSWGSVVRLIRRRIVLGFIFGLSLTYCAISLLAPEKMGPPVTMFEDNVEDNMIVDNEDILLDGDVDEETSGKHFPWPVHAETDDGNPDSTDMLAFANTNDTETIPWTCRNSIQGKSLIVDERGLVCARRDVLPTGCCNNQEKILPNDKTTIKNERYSCETCNLQGCCAVYEYCVSCCLHPAKRRPKKESHGAPARRDTTKTRKVQDVVKLRFRNLDRFQVCLAVCRTSSASVRHENTYKDPHSKHCYVTTQTGRIQSQRSERDLSLINNNGVNGAITSSLVKLFILITFPCLCIISPTFFKDKTLLGRHYLQSMLVIKEMNEWHGTRLDLVLQTSL